MYLILNNINKLGINIIEYICNNIKRLMTHILSKVFIYVYVRAFKYP